MKRAERVKIWSKTWASVRRSKIGHVVALLVIPFYLRPGHFIGDAQPRYARRTKIWMAMLAAIAVNVTPFQRLMEWVWLHGKVGSAGQLVPSAAHIHELDCLTNILVSVSGVCMMFGVAAVRTGWNRVVVVVLQRSGYVAKNIPFRYFALAAASTAVYAGVGMHVVAYELQDSGQPVVMMQHLASQPAWLLMLGGLAIASVSRWWVINHERGMLEILNQPRAALWRANMLSLTSAVLVLVGLASCH
jgi:hypothetical protein